MELYEKLAAEQQVQRIPCWHDSELLLLPACEADTFAAWDEAFAAAGYMKLDESEREGNCTAIYAGADAVYTLSYTAFEETCRLIRDTTTTGYQHTHLPGAGDTDAAAVLLCRLRDAVPDPTGRRSVCGHRCRYG